MKCFKIKLEKLVRVKLCLMFFVKNEFRKLERKYF